MSKKPDLYLEESIFDDFSQDFESLEMPLSKRAFTLVMFFAIVIGTVVFVRIAYLGVKSDALYKDRALANMSDVRVLPAQRGIFFDKFGNPLVKNTAIFKATLKLSDFLKQDLNAQIAQEADMEKIFNLPAGQIRQWLSEVNLERQNSFALGDNLTIDQVAQIKALNYKGVNIENDFKREYEGNGSLSHALGYVGLVSGSDLKDDPNLLLNDLIGKAGLEFYYDDDLRGQNGAIYNYRNAKNESMGQSSTIESINGKNLYLTIDKDLQNYFYDRLKKQVDDMGRSAGVGIALNPQTGAVLSLFSLPSFDPNKITSNDLVSSQRPLFNRAVSGIYSPGSTIKPLVAIAALNENIISPLKQIYSKGYIELANPYNPDKPSRFLDWKAHGWVDMYSALARSSDVYFYEVGGGFGDQKGLGISKLREYWDKFGLDQKTGIDLPGEKVGFLPDVEEKEKRSGTPWRIGDTYNVSIGQGDLMTTPIELINYISAIANGGKFYRPYLVERMANEKGETVAQTTPEVIRDITSFKNSIIEVEKGMIDGSQKPYGTSYPLHDLPFTVATKTGSAQIEWNKKVNAFFVGYGPVGSAQGADPQIAIFILIEDAKDGGGNTIPVARDVMKWYYENRLKK